MPVITIFIIIIIIILGWQIHARELHTRQTFPHIIL